MGSPSRASRPCVSAMRQEAPLSLRLQLVFGRRGRCAVAVGNLSAQTANCAFFCERTGEASQVASLAAAAATSWGPVLNACSFVQGSPFVARAWYQALLWVTSRSSCSEYWRPLLRAVVVFRVTSGADPMHAARYRDGCAYLRTLATSIRRADRDVVASLTQVLQGESGPSGRTCRGSR